jgi:hypothetical protein
MRAKPAAENGCPRSDRKTNGDRSDARRSRLRARSSDPVRGCADGVPRLTWSDLIPPQVHQLRHPQAVTIGQQDHGRVGVPPPVRPGGGHQLLDLGVGQVLPRAQIGIGFLPIALAGVARRPFNRIAVDLPEIALQIAGGRDDEIARMFVKKIQCICFELVVDAVTETDGTDEMKRQCPMQTDAEEPIEAGKMMHVGLRYEGMAHAQELAR